MNPDEGKEQRDRWEDSPCWPQQSVADGITSSAFCRTHFLALCFPMHSAFPVLLWDIIQGSGFNTNKGRPFYPRRYLHMVAMLSKEHAKTDKGKSSIMKSLKYMLLRFKGTTRAIKLQYEDIH